MSIVSNQQLQALVNQIKSQGRALGFDAIGITDIDLAQAEKRLQDWLAKKFHGSMTYMLRHGVKRSRPDYLVPGTIRVISARMNYLSEQAELNEQLEDTTRAAISVYAQGKDYHRLIRKRLAMLAHKIQETVSGYHYRAFADSAPVMEKPLAEKAGLGWIGKNTNLIHHQSGSWFFLGTIYTDLPLPIDTPASAHCGHCHACLDICPTQAIVAPYQLDARRCISYLTIENKGSIPEALRPLIGNRVYGCDDCQLVCPWNKFAKFSKEDAFSPRNNLHQETLLQLFNWTEEMFYKRLAGSAIRRIGYDCWLRNLAVGLGNAPYNINIIKALEAKKTYPNDMVAEHIVWALACQREKAYFS